MFVKSSRTLLLIVYVFLWLVSTTTVSSNVSKNPDPNGEKNADIENSKIVEKLIASNTVDQLYEKEAIAEEAEMATQTDWMCLVYRPCFLLQKNHNNSIASILQALYNLKSFKEFIKKLKATKTENVEFILKSIYNRMDENGGGCFDINTDVEKLIDLVTKNSQIPWDDSDEYNLSHFIHLLTITIKNRKLVSNYFLYEYDLEYMKKIQDVKNYDKISAEVENNKGHVKCATRRSKKQKYMPLQKIYVHCTAKRKNPSNFCEFKKIYNKDYILKSIVCRTKSNDPQYFVVGSYQNEFYILEQCYSRKTNLTDICAENDVLVALYEQL